VLSNSSQLLRRYTVLIQDMRTPRRPLIGLRGVRVGVGLGNLGVALRVQAVEERRPSPGNPSPSCFRLAPGDEDDLDSLPDGGHGPAADGGWS
jgi:hypothetical protein